MEITYDEVLTRLLRVFQQRFRRNLDGEDEGVLDEHLLGIHFQFDPADLLYLFFDVEREFAIRVPEEEIAAGHFDTLRHIADIIYRQLQLTV